jgi:hypothetical protein
MSDELPTTPSPQAVGTGSAGLIDRVKGILMQPKAEWQEIAGETTEPTKLFTTYALPLALIGPIATFIGVQLFGYGAGILSIKLGLGAALGIAVTTLVAALISLFVIAFVANFVSPHFGGKNDFPAAFRLVTYALTASWVGGIFGLIPAVAIIGLLFGLYSLYLLYLGAAPVMGVPQDKAIGYTAVTVLIAIVVNIVVSFVVGSITASMFLASATTLAANDATLQLGDLGSVTVDGDNSTVDLGELGRVEVNGDTATVTVDGQQMQVNVEEAQAAAAKAKAAAAQ